MSELFPDEVVTRAYVRGVDLPLGAGRMALITLDNGHDHTKPNTLGPTSLGELDRALDEAYAMPDVVAVAVTGKPFILAAGADLKGIALVRDRETGRSIAQLGHRVMRRLGEGPVPSFGFVNGMALGGGFELALHCTYRTVSASAQGIGLPETFIGIVPGWGGAWLVPNLVGIDKAVTVVVENPLNTKVLGGAQVRALGLADEAFEAADFLEQSMLWAARVLTGEVAVERPEVDRSEEAWAAAVARGRAAADAKVRGLSPAPYRALDLLAAARTSSKDEGFAAEDEALADLLMTDETRATLYAFDLVQRRAKRPVGVPDRSLAREVTSVGVVGAGLMASQLALLFARRLEVPVVMTDLDQERVDKGVASVHAEVDKLLGKGRVSPDQANRLKALVSGSTDKAAFADADFVIEAVFEQLEVKKQVFAELEGIVSHECVLATNTSSLSVTDMAAELKNPERVVGFHFFNPVAVMPLLEVVRAERTDDATLATAFEVGKKLKKSCVLVKDAPAFVFNRLITRALGEAIGAVDGGTPFEVADRALAPLGMPMPPFVLLQLVGPAVALHTAETMHEAFPDRFGRSPGMQALVGAGKPGVYVWDEQGRPSVDPEIAALWPQGDTVLTEEQVLDRTRRALADEIRVMLDEGVVAEVQDIDLCLILGGGFAFANGGVAPYLDRTGTSEAVNGRRFLPPGVASVPS
ncbi:MAG TPA: 3-hydroxyacyl-CoA dehydrogenase NAD-binding domain-containing protein [Jiangellales bacterium]|nr:3-hydroxyacyl-CoA dehydrogenase NAD-binding domain-containing protein [Jiangellales bacterium]